MLFISRVRNPFLPIDRHIDSKRVRAVRGYFGPLFIQKLKIAFHQFLLIGLLDE